MVYHSAGTAAGEITGSNPVARLNLQFTHTPFDAPVAQWIEYWASNPGVAGSSPAGRATIEAKSALINSTRADYSVPC